MSNKTQLQTNNTKLESLIQTLQGKAAGGGSVETCTLNIGSYILTAGATLYQDGAILAYNGRGNNGTCENVVCGSTIYIRHMADSSEYSAENLELLMSITGHKLFKVTAGPGEVASIAFSAPPEQ